ncbi:MAG: helix-turn-helix transcriptional regulator [Oscillospiraceae bacterium]|nr:helix-turn-helix transcriptional regulator [Oscillospiraceae bacterium]MBR6658082.1 helix-turn-helix transcriptional regulator [Oscillospiraceae bacterium]
MSLGEKISDLRKKNGISQEKLAELLGISRQAVTKWESGKGNPDTENLIRLSEIFGVSLDELCGKEAEKPKAKIHPGGHLLCLVSLLVVTAYCVIGGITKTFNGETLIMFIILAIPMHCFTHLIFWGMVKSGEFSMLAGYDSEIKYDTENLKRYVSGLDFMLGFETASYLFIMAATALIVPEFEIQYILLFGYIISFVAGIFFMGYKFGDKIYSDPADAKKAKRAFPSEIILMVMIFSAIAAFVLFFELKGYQNNTAKPFPMLGMAFVSIGFSLGGYLAESKRLKKEEEPKPLFGKPFIICNALAVAAIITMAIL